MYEMIPRDFLDCKQHAGYKHYIVGERLFRDDERFVGT